MQIKSIVVTNLEAIENGTATIEVDFDDKGRIYISVNLEADPCPINLYLAPVHANEFGRQLRQAAITASV